MKKAAALIPILLSVKICWAAQPITGNAQLISFRGPEGPLQGYVYVPQGDGPFPAVLWNHGSEKQPGAEPDLAEFYTAHGFVFFMPHRHRQGKSAPGGFAGRLQGRSTYSAAVWTQEIANEDVVAAMTWLRAQSQVDPHRIIISGCSLGGIQTLLAAEKGLGARAFVAFAPGAMSWSDLALEKRLALAVHNAKSPVFILQAQNDFSIAPTEILGEIAKARGGQARIYPAFGNGPKDGHWAFATTKAGIAVWQTDVLEFIAAALAEPLTPSRAPCPSWQCSRGTGSASERHSIGGFPGHLVGADSSDFRASRPCAAQSTFKFRHPQG